MCLNFFLFCLCKTHYNLDKWIRKSDYSAEDPEPCLSWEENTKSLPVQNTTNFTVSVKFRWSFLTNFLTKNSPFRPKYGILIQIFGLMSSKASLSLACLGTSKNRWRFPLFDEGFGFRNSFDIESLFTNVPLKRTLNLVLKRVFTDGLIDTTLSKRTLKKLLLDACTKTVFSFDNTLYEQIDGVSMGSCLAPVLANIILTEFEKLVVDDLVNSGILKFYRRYVDDTLVLMKVSDIPFVLNKFNNFDKNLKFTVDTFDSGKVHFLDLEISQSGINIYRKPTHTGQYTHFDSFEPCMGTQNGLDKITFPSRCKYLQHFSINRFCKFRNSWPGTGSLHKSAHLLFVNSN